jgi:hypothetical protein
MSYNHLTTTSGCKFVDKKRFLLIDKESRAADNNEVQSTTEFTA